MRAGTAVAMRLACAATLVFLGSGAARATGPKDGGASPTSESATASAAVTIATEPAQIACMRRAMTALEDEDLIGFYRQVAAPFGPALCEEHRAFGDFCAALVEIRAALDASFGPLLEPATSADEYASLLRSMDAETMRTLAKNLRFDWSEGPGNVTRCALFTATRDGTEKRAWTLVREGGEWRLADPGTGSDPWLEKVRDMHAQRRARDYGARALADLALEIRAHRYARLEDAQRRMAAIKAEWAEEARKSIEEERASEKRSAAKDQKRDH